MLISEGAVVVKSCHLERSIFDRFVIEIFLFLVSRSSSFASVLSPKISVVARRNVLFYTYRASSLIPEDRSKNPQKM